MNKIKNIINKINDFFLFLSQRKINFLNYHLSKYILGELNKFKKYYLKSENQDSVFTNDLNYIVRAFESLTRKKKIVELTDEERRGLQAFSDNFVNLTIKK